MSDEFSRGSSTMEVNGLSCTLNMPPALKSQRDGDGLEVAHALPKYAPRTALRVAEYDEACPESWIRGGPDEASYFVPVQAEHGLWLDFNANQRHSHYVAVLISVQGVNPITGQPVGDDRLEQYRKKCPVHKTIFGEERFCEKCGYKWDAQNYLAGNATTPGYFWLDGFRAADGVVRQYVFTEETARGVAAQILGEERVFAIGIAFYLSKEPKPPVPTRSSVRNDDWRHMTIGASGGHELFGSSVSHRQPIRLRRMTLAASSEVRYKASARNSSLSPTKSLEIAAGAKINQRIYQDPEKLDFWQEEAAGRIYINYCPVELAREIIATGKNDLTAGGEGFMKELVVGQG